MTPHRAVLAELGNRLRKLPGLESLEDHFALEPGPVHVSWGLNERFRVRCLSLTDCSVTVAFVDRGLSTLGSVVWRSRYAPTDEQIETATSEIAHYLIAGIEPPAAEALRAYAVVARSTSSAR